MLSLLLSLLALSASTTAGDTQPPFVPGFDRFGRHGELDTRLAGRVLLSELSCTACHASSDAVLTAKSGPNLAGVADRLDETWLRRFLTAPQSVKPGTTMPDLLAGVPEDERAATVDALVAFLGTQHRPWPTIKAGGANPVLHHFWERGDRENGRRLYHSVGCVACHEPDPDFETVETKPTPLDEMLAQLDSEEIAELGLAGAVRPVNPVPHPDLPAKYSLRSLTYFLLDPTAIRPGGRMPSLKLKAVEAADIAAWLLRDQQQPITTPTSHDDAQVTRGRALFGELGCANCHSAGVKPAGTAKPLARLDASATKSCLTGSSAGLPFYPLDAAQRGAVQTALGATSDEDTPAESVPLRMLQLNCYGCHERDERGGVGRNLRPYFETAGHVDIGDEGRIPPPLTGVGHKLETAWLKTVLQGKGDVRPHMQARMPMFPGHIVGRLPEQLARIDRPKQPPATSPADGRPTDDNIAAGRALMDIGCVQCHLFGGEALPGVVGVDLLSVPDRIRADWFHEFLLDPGGLKKRTRMPSFFPGGKSQNTGILDGDPDRQIAAMWAYLKQGSDQPLPAKIEEVRRQDFELKPTDRPIILRTFMPQAGTHAIAVGLPAGVHYAFDAEQLRLTRIWTGRFLDAQGTWFSRFAPPAEPLGEKTVMLPPGPPLAWLTHADQPWPTAAAEAAGNRFRGYRLDAEGVPTFLYDIGRARVEDRTVASDDGVVRRRLMVTLPSGKRSAVSRLWLRALTGMNLNVSERSCINQAGLRVSLSDGTGGELQTVGETTEWRVPLGMDKKQVHVELQYQW